MVTLIKDKKELLASELSQQMQEIEALDMEIKLQLCKVNFRI